MRQFTISRTGHLLLAMLISVLGRAELAQAVSGTEAGTIQTAKELLITPENLVLAELHESATVILQRINQAHELRQTLGIKRNAVNAAVNSVTLLAQQIASSGNDSQANLQYNQALAALQVARTQFGQVRDALVEVALVDLPSQAVQRFHVCRSNMTLVVPAAFRVKEFSLAQWQTIEAALRAEVRCQRRGETMEPSQAELLSSVRADFDVIAASLRLSNNLASVEAVFQQYE